MTPAEREAALRAVPWRSYFVTGGVGFSTERKEPDYPVMAALAAGWLEKIEKERIAAYNKWWEYEQEYILPTFRWAKEVGIDLPALVGETPGTNCVALFFGAIRGRLVLAEAHVTALAEALRAWKVRLACVGHPNEPSDWSTPIRLTDAALARLDADRSSTC